MIGCALVVATPPRGTKRIITDFFHPPQGGGKRSRIPEEESLLPRVLDAVIYIYYDHTGTPVYVGQTIRDLFKRYIEHLRSTRGKFDITSMMVAARARTWAHKMSPFSTCT